MSQKLFNFQESLTESNEKRLQIIKFENKELRAYVQQLHNEIESGQGGVNKKVKAFEDQMGSVESFMTVQVDFVKQI